MRLAEAQFVRKSHGARARDQKQRFLPSTPALVSEEPRGIRRSLAWVSPEAGGTATGFISPQAEPEVQKCHSRWRNHRNPRCRTMAPRGGAERFGDSLQPREGRGFYSDFHPGVLLRSTPRYSLSSFQLCAGNSGKWQIP